MQERTQRLGVPERVLESLRDGLVGIIEGV
jgi:hypothetical protein